MEQNIKLPKFWKSAGFAVIYPYAGTAKSNSPLYLLFAILQLLICLVILVRDMFPNISIRSTFLQVFCCATTRVDFSTACPSKFSANQGISNVRPPIVFKHLKFADFQC